MSVSPAAAAPSPPPSRLASGLTLAVLGAVAFSGKAIIVKLAYRHGVDAVTLLMLRMALALPFFILMAWWAGCCAKTARCGRKGGASPCSGR